MISYILYTVLSLVLILLAYAYYNARSGRCDSTAKLDGKTVIVTGANTGIGKETAKDLAKRGATVVLACRDMKKGESAAKEIKEATGNSNVFLRKLDLASLKSVREFSENFLKEFKHLHILINNAGIMICPYWKTEDGFEMQIGVNHFGHFALTNHLLKRIVESAPSRIVNVSSSASYYLPVIDVDDLNWEKRKYDKQAAYGQSKISTVLFTNELHGRLSDKNVSSFCLHPGAVSTDLQRHNWLLNIGGKYMAGIFVKTPTEGAQTSIYCAVQEGLEKESGKFFENCRVVEPAKKSKDKALARRLWEKSEELTKVQYPL